MEDKKAALKIALQMPKKRGDEPISGRVGN